VADRREGLARLTGQVGALRSRAAAAEQEIGRLSAAHDEALVRVERAEAELAALQSEAGGLDEGEVGLDERHETTEAAKAQAQEVLTALIADEREAERDRSTWAARRDALVSTLTRKDGTAALLAADLPGVLGSVASLVHVSAGAETAVAAALGAVADAVAVAGPGPATAALQHLKDDDAGRAGLLVGGSGFDVSAPWPALPEGAQWAIDLITTSDELRPALTRLLDRVAVVPDLAAAQRLAEQGLRAVTAEGDLVGRDWAAGGSASAPSLLEVQVAVDEAGARHDEATQRHERLGFEVARAKGVLQESQHRVDEALEALHQSDARMAAMGEQLGLLGSAAQSARAEAGRLAQSQVKAEEARDRDLSGLAELEERLALAEQAPLEEDPSTTVRDRLAAEATEVRAAEMEARLAVRTGEERARALAGRAESLERAARSERAERERMVALTARREKDAVVAEQVVLGAQQALEQAGRSLVVAAQEREQAQQARTVLEGELLALRTRTRELSGELERLTDSVHRDEVARAEQRLRIEALESRAVEEWSVPLEQLLADYGPEVLVPGAPGEGDDPDGEPTPYDRAAQEKRAGAAERALALLGKVNPLALEEYAALQERAAFLTTQLEDLKDTRRDLMTVVKEVDERILAVFAEAFEDTAREFVQVFATLFPGGEGSLVLTDPDDLLTTGIEVLARPAGKKISRLSLLSGGERSLTAIALLVAIFRARPSPFYVMDEVEAALDDRNLGRLLELFTGLRESSQLIVITHQKRTMEIADALYGVTMRGDGVSAVVSQRLREPESA
jgi:chromosome segregation protein